MDSRCGFKFELGEVLVVGPYLVRSTAPNTGSANGGMVKMPRRWVLPRAHLTPPISCPMQGLAGVRQELVHVFLFPGDTDCLVLRELNGKAGFANTF